MHELRGSNKMITFYIPSSHVAFFPVTAIAACLPHLLWMDEAINELHTLLCGYQTIQMPQVRKKYSPRQGHVPLTRHSVC